MVYSLKKTSPYLVFITLYGLATPRSSSGRTADSGSAYLGSNPSLGTIIKTPISWCFYLYV
jgi:hypothetical protein